MAPDAAGFVGYRVRERIGSISAPQRHPDATGLLTELVVEGDPWLPPDPPGVVVRRAPVPGSDPPTLLVRFDIVLQP